MVTIGQIEKGVASYLDAELMPNFPNDGIQKVLAGTVIGLAIRKSGSIIQSFSDNQYVKMLGIMDDEGNVDLDLLKDEFKKNISENGFVLDIPMFGTMTFHKADVDKLYKHIMGGDQ